MTVERLPRRFIEKVWGVDRLPPAFSQPPGKRIGEVHFEPPAQMPQLLAKHIYTSERLSIQCHPDDEQARKSGHASGKSEGWLICSAEPGATIGIGLDRPTDRDTLRAAAIDGSIVEMMTWHAVAPGDFFYIPANTVHAIGAGVGLIEIQQNSDLTYRLYDYGRPRELHLDEGLAIADARPYPPGLSACLAENQNRRLVAGPHFELWAIADASTIDEEILDRPILVVPARSECTINGESVVFGECAWVDRIERLALATAAQILLARPVRDTD